MSILTPADFIGEVNIPDTDSPATTERLQIYIDKYEPKFLRCLLGLDLYSQLLVGLEAEAPEQKWLDLVASFNEALACYVYYWWVRGNNTYTNRTGTSKAKSENATGVSPTETLTDAWNTMVSNNWELVRDWNETTYGTYYMRASQLLCHDIFKRINTWNL